LFDNREVLLICNPKGESISLINREIIGGLPELVTCIVQYLQGA
jgi:hypothetical protein